MSVEQPTEATVRATAKTLVAEIIDLVLYNMQQNKDKFATTTIDLMKDTSDIGHKETTQVEHNLPATQSTPGVIQPTQSVPSDEDSSDARRESFVNDRNRQTKSNLPLQDNHVDTNKEEISTKATSPPTDNKNQTIPNNTQISDKLEQKDVSDTKHGTMNSELNKKSTRSLDVTIDRKHPLLTKTFKGEKDIELPPDGSVDAPNEFEQCEQPANAATEDMTAGQELELGIEQANTSHQPKQQAKNHSNELVQEDTQKSTKAKINDEKANPEFREEVSNRENTSAKPTEEVSNNKKSSAQSTGKVNISRNDAISTSNTTTSINNTINTFSPKTSSVSTAGSINTSTSTTSKSDKVSINSKQRIDTSAPMTKKSFSGSGSVSDDIHHTTNSTISHVVHNMRRRAESRNKVKQKSQHRQQNSNQNEFNGRFIGNITIPTDTESSIFSATDDSCSNSTKHAYIGPQARNLLSYAGLYSNQNQNMTSNPSETLEIPQPRFPFSPQLLESVIHAVAGNPELLFAELVRVGRICRHLDTDNQKLRARISAGTVVTPTPRNQPISSPTNLSTSEFDAQHISHDTTTPSREKSLSSQQKNRKTRTSAKSSSKKTKKKVPTSETSLRPSSAKSISNSGKQGKKQRLKSICRPTAASLARDAIVQQEIQMAKERGLTEDSHEEWIST